MTDQEAREATGIARNQNVVYSLSHDRSVVAEFLAPALARVDAEQPDTQLLIITAGPEEAVALADAAGQLSEARPLRILAATSAARAGRLLRERPAQVLVGGPRELLSLLKSSAFKAETVKALVLAWADEILVAGATAELEAVMAEVPKEGARTLVAGQLGEAVEAFIERYLRRARRVAPPPAQPTEGTTAPVIEYVVVNDTVRPATFRRLLDELDPDRAAVLARAAESQTEVGRTLRALGYGDTDRVRLTQGIPVEGAATLILYDVPGSHQELQTLVVDGTSRVIALVQPRQLPYLRALAPGMAVRPLTISDAVLRARGADESLRAELRDALAAGTPSREVLALEPLLAEFDAVELAAVALRLLEQERARGRAAASTMARPSASTPSTSAGEWKRIFINAGDRDGIRAGDLVGAITGEASITSQEIGKIELRENHSLVEIAAAHADAVVAKLTGTMIRGRRIVARLDADRGSRGDRPAGVGERSSHGDRGPRGDRSSPRGDRPSRGERPPRGDRPAGRDRGGFGDRPRGRNGGERGSGPRGRADGDVRREGRRPPRPHE